jgi:hypothetical protein
MPAYAGDAAAETELFPHWFTQFLNDRQTRKPSAHTMKAYRQDFVAITALMTDGNPARLTVADITKDSMRQAFAAYAREHEAVSIRRCRSTWNVLCTMSASQRRRRRIASAPTRPSVLSSRRTVCGTSSCGRISGRRSASRGGGWRTFDRSAVTLGSA